MCTRRRYLMRRAHETLVSLIGGRPVSETKGIRAWRIQNFCVYKTPKSGVVAHLLEIMVFPAVQHSLNWMDLSPIPLAENDIVPINIIFNIMS